MTDPIKKEDAVDDPKVDKPQVDATVEAVKDVANTFASELKAIREDAAAKATAAAPEPASGPTQAELQREYEDVKTKYNELCAAGEYAEARELERAFETRVASAAPRQKDEDTPAYKALYATARKESKREHADIYETYGAEVEAEVAQMSAADRINPDMWDEAIRRVKLDHLDEIIAKEREAVEEKEKGTYVAPSAGGSGRGKSSSTSTDLTEEQLDAAKVLGFTPEDYKKAVEESEGMTIKRGLSAGMVHLVDPGKPQEGHF